MEQPSGTRRRRADAERSIEAIVEAAVRCLGRRPDASMSEVATAAGVGRVTLYAHFPSREALLGAAIERTATRVSAALDAARIDDGPAPAALARMVRLGWPALDGVWGLHVAAGGNSPALLRAHGVQFLSRIEQLIARGRAEGSFRADLPIAWHVAALYTLVHAAGQEVSEGRLDPAIAADVLVASLTGLLSVQPTQAEMPPSSSGRGGQ
ncbi:MAG: TetR/AcrR family transcriptional regulator [Acidimicrobiales bacterium]